MKFVSGHVIFCLLYKNTYDDVFDHFPKISEHFPKISEDSSKVVQRPDARFWTFPEDFQGRTDNVSIMYSNKSKGLCNHSNGNLFICENSMLFSCVKISCLHMKAHLVFHWCLYNKTFYYPVATLLSVKWLLIGGEKQKKMSNFSP